MRMTSRSLPSVEYCLSPYRARAAIQAARELGPLPDSERHAFADRNPTRVPIGQPQTGPKANLFAAARHLAARAAMGNTHPDVFKRCHFQYVHT